jgi:hypothetical protein
MAKPELLALLQDMVLEPKPEPLALPQDLVLEPNPDILQILLPSVLERTNMLITLPSIMGVTTITNIRKMVIRTMDKRTRFQVSRTSLSDI